MGVELVSALSIASTDTIGVVINVLLMYAVVRYIEDNKNEKLHMEL